MPQMHRYFNFHANAFLPIVQALEKHNILTFILKAWKKVSFGLPFAGRHKDPFCWCMKLSNNVFSYCSVWCTRIFICKFNVICGCSYRFWIYLPSKTCDFRIFSQGKHLSTILNFCRFWQQKGTTKQQTGGNFTFLHLKHLKARARKCVAGNASIPLFSG